MLDLYYRAYGVLELLAHRTAETAGIYKQAGVEVSLKDGSGAKWSEVAKSAPLSIGIGGTVQECMVGGANWSVICITTQYPLFWIVAQPSVSSIADLKGAAVTGPPPMAPPAVFLRSIFRKHGLDLLKDCSYAPLPDDQRTEQLKRGDVAAAQIGISPGVTPFSLERVGLRVLTFFGSEVHPVTSGLGLNLDLLSPDDPEVQRLVSATRTALARLHDDRELALRVIQDIDGTLSQEDAGLLYDQYIQPHWSTDGRPDRRMAEESLSEVARELGVSPAPAFSEIYHTP